MAVRRWRPVLALVSGFASCVAHAQGGSVSDARGEASYRIPIVVPPGPAGHQPDLALVYNSGDGKGAAGWLGFGWALAGESRIERESRTGSPYDYDNPSCGAAALHPCYRTSYVLDGQDLICSSGTCSTCSSGAPCRYRTQSDDGRIIEFRGDASGWRIQDRDGRTSLYGAASTGTGRLLNPASLIGHVYGWQLESTTDVSGNTILYTYDTTSSASIAYLKRIEYGQGTTANRSVEFILNDLGSAPRPDKPVSLRAGFRQQTDRRVTSIEVRAASDALVTRYDLGYSQDPDSLRSQLATVRRVGSDAITSLPPYRFDYSFRAPARGLLGTFDASFSSEPSCFPGGGLYAASSVAGVVASVADMDRDGLADLYQVENYNNGLAGGVAVALGTGSRFLAGPGRSCGSEPFGSWTPWSTAKLLFAESFGGSAVMDFDGDGYLDHLYLAGFPYDGVAPYLRRGGADGFIDPPLHTSFELADSWRFDLGNNAYTINEPYLRIAETSFNSNVDVIAAMADVTGDGRPDLVTTRFRGPYGYCDAAGCDPAWASWNGWAVFVNRGLKSGAGGMYLDFGAEPIRWPAPLNAPIQHDYLGLISSYILADQNGDGLADRVFRDFVEYGSGAGFYAQESVPSQISASLSATTICTQDGTYDLNGDGFLDHIKAEGSQAANPSWTVHFGTGHGFGTQAKSFPADGGGISPGCIDADGQNAASSLLRDVNGDGVPDRLRDPAGVMLNAGALDASAALDPNLPSAVLPGLMLRATDPLGGVVEFTYLAAPQMLDASGLPANPGFSLAKPLVTRVRHLDGRAGTPAITTRFWYGNGVFDYAEAEFRGFGTVIATAVEDGVDSTQVTSTFLTDRVCAFSRVSTQVALGATVFARESMTYQKVTGGGTPPAQWTKCLPSTLVVETVEGNEVSTKVRRSSWDYGNPVKANYNPVRFNEWGEWNLTTNQDVPGDERITQFTYATASTAWPSIVSRVRIEMVKDAAGKVYSDRRYCYSFPNCLAAAKGLTLIVREILADYTAVPPVIGSLKTVATIAYDAFGNPTQVTGAASADDPDGLRTTIAYDGTYQTFPTSISRGSDVSLPLRPLVTTLAYAGCAGGLTPPPALGLSCGRTAPQGQADLLGYDALGRVIRVERPSSAYVETRSSTLPGAASPGENVLETRMIRSGFSDLVGRQYMDGLARVYRSESPGKQSQTVIVDRSFDSRGRVRTESLPYSSGDGQLRSFSYDALDRPTIVLDPDGVTQRVQSYEPWMLVDETYFGSATPGNRKQRTERTSDGLGRLVRVAQFEDAVAATTPYLVTAKYDAADRLYEVRDPIANNGALCTSLDMGAQCTTQDHVTEITWDSFGRRIRIDDPDSGVWTYKYDDAGQMTERTQNPGTGSARSQTLRYDALGRLEARAFSPTGSGVTNASFVYENDPSNPDYGQLIRVSSADSSGTTYLYGYDAAGRRDAIIQLTAGKEFATMWVYDELDRVKRRLFPDGDAFDYDYDGIRLLRIRADTANIAFTGTVLKHADYDALGRMKWVEVGEGAGNAALATVAYDYDSTSARLARITGTPGNLVADDGDGDRITAASDKCPNAYDPDQLDAGGLGAASAPDGIGDACQCGDVDGSGKVTTGDAAALSAFIVSGSALARPELCDVNGDGDCQSADHEAVSAAASIGSGNLQNCLPARPGNLPSSAALDLSVNFDGLGRLTSQAGSLGPESLSRSFTYDGLSRLRTAVGPWEKYTGATGSVTWSYTYDALGNLRRQSSDRAPSGSADNRTWTYGHPTKPHFLSEFAQQGRPAETLSASLAGEVSQLDRGAGYAPETFVWNAQNRLHRYQSSTDSYDAFDETTLVVTGPTGSQSSIVSVGDDFEYDIGAQRANKSFSIDGVRIASLATSYAAPNAETPPALRFVLRHAGPLAGPAALALLLLGLVGLASQTLRRRTPRWLSATGVGLLSVTLVGLPYTVFAATLTIGPGAYGRHAEPILAYLTDHLGSIRATVNQDGIVVETRDYAPFGESIAHSGAFSLEHRFTGQPQDEQTGGLYNYGARFYNPKWGRFISPDDVVQGFDSQGLNPYSYVLNRPTSATDPTGRFIWNGVSFGAWSTATLQSGVLQTSPAGVPTPSSGSSFAAGFHTFSRPIPAFLGILGESVIRPTVDFLRALSKVIYIDLQAVWLGALSQFLFNPFLAVGDLLDATVNRDPARMRNAVWRLIEGTLVPRYGLQNGPYWGRDKSTNETLDSVLDAAGYAHDGMCDPACSNAADREWIRVAWSDPLRLGPYGRAYRLLGTAAFSARIAWRSAFGSK